jgi:hypothetical protein
MLRVGDLLDERQSWRFWWKDSGFSALFQIGVVRVEKLP